MNSHSSWKRCPRPNIIVAIAIIVLSLSVVRALTPTFVLAPLQRYSILFEFQPSMISGHLGGLSSDDEYGLLLNRLTTDRVLRTTLTDPRLASLPWIRTSTDPLDALRGTITTGIVIKPPAPLLVLSLSADAPSLDEAKMVCEVMIAAIRPQVPPMTRNPFPPTGQMILGHYGWGPLDKPWKVNAGKVLALLAPIAALFWSKTQENADNSTNRVRHLEVSEPVAIT